MPAEVTICNLALSRIGDSASVSSINPPDGSAQAEACSRLYPLALSTALDLHNWSFATRRASLAELADGTVEKGPWAHAYALPANCKRIIDLRPSGEAEAEERAKFLGKPIFRPYRPKIEFEVAGTSSGQAVLTNLESPIIRYVCSDPNASQFTGLFADALSWLLASYLAGEVIRDSSGHSFANNCLKNYQGTMSSAMQQDARQVHTKPRPLAPWIARR